MGTASHLARESPAPFAAQVAEVEVDVETGEVTVAKLVMAVDCGVAINPITASGQVEGRHGDGARVRPDARSSSSTERGGRSTPGSVPTGSSVPTTQPPTEVFLVQTMEPTGPFGAKAVGEIPVDGVAPAVRNAILDATGVALDTLPLTPERVWNALRASEEQLADLVLSGPLVRIDRPGHVEEMG